MTPIILKGRMQRMVEGFAREAVEAAMRLPRPSGARRLHVEVELSGTFAREVGMEQYLSCDVEVPDSP